MDTSLMRYDTNQFHLPSRVWGFAEAGTEDEGEFVSETERRLTASATL